MVQHSTTFDYYKELGVHRHATSNEIRTAYKRLALIWHPDRNKAKEAEEKFKKIKQAHDILIDEQQRREYDHEQQQQQSWFDKTNRTSFYQTKEEQFNLQTFENLISNPIDPFDILSDIQMFQESDFTSKMMNSPSYRNLYIHLFNSMNNHNSKPNSSPYTSTPIFMNNDRIFRSNPSKSSRPKPQTQQQPPIKPIPVIHSTMPNDWFLNELINLHEQQTYKSHPSDLSHCRKCHRKLPNNRTRLIQQEKSCQINSNKQYTTIPSKSVPA